MAAQTKTILLVDDDQFARGGITEMLRGMGYEVIEASTGPEALAASDRHAGGIDLLITDLIMPGMTGRMLADALTAKRPGLPVVFISGYVEGDRQEDLGPGVLYLQKPVTWDSLKQKVREAMKKKA